MMRAWSWEAPRWCPSSNCSSARTLAPDLASTQAAALPSPTSPTTTTAYDGAARPWRRTFPPPSRPHFPAPPPRPPPRPTTVQPVRGAAAWPGGRARSPSGLRPLLPQAVQDVAADVEAGLLHGGEPAAGVGARGHAPLDALAH